MGPAASTLRLPVCAGRKCRTLGRGARGQPAPRCPTPGMRQNSGGIPSNARVPTALPRGSRISRDLEGSTGPHGSSGTGTRVCARAGRPGGAGSGARRLPRAAVRGSAGLVDVSPLKLRVLARWHLVPEGRAGVLCKRIHPPHPLSPPPPK